MAFAAAGRHSLYVERMGAGSPSVVFDAALGASSLSWALVQPAIAEETLTLSYDRAGLGRSEAGPMPRTASRIVDELRLLLDRARPGATLHVSVPNARHLGLVRDLLLRGTFGYTEFGHRDSTHLHWFTRRDLEAGVSGAGWTITASQPNPFRGRDEPFNRATRGALREFIALQWNVLATAS